MSNHRYVLIAGAALLGVALAFLLRPAAPPAAPERRLPQRVVCISPSMTEILFALGQGRRVVGIGQYTVWPPESARLPVCGGFVNPDAERILSLHPDLIVTQEFATKVIELARAQRTPCLAPEMQDLKSVFHCIALAGATLGAEPAAATLSAQIQRDLDAVRERVKGRPAPRVFLSVGREAGSLQNLMTAGKTSYLSEVLELAGGENVFGDVNELYPTAGKEALLQRQPELIIELVGEGMIDETQQAKRSAAWSALPTLPAVRNGRIVAIGDTYALMPGPRIARLAERFAEILHPVR